MHYTSAVADNSADVFAEKIIPKILLNTFGRLKNICYYINNIIKVYLSAESGR